MSTVGDVSTIPPGWYPDPENASRSRWWDGSAWTAATSEPQPVAPQEAFVPRPAAVPQPHFEQLPFVPREERPTENEVVEPEVRDRAVFAPQQAELQRFTQPVAAQPGQALTRRQLRELSAAPAPSTPAVHPDLVEAPASGVITPASTSGSPDSAIADERAASPATPPVSGAASSQIAVYQEPPMPKVNPYSAPPAGSPLDHAPAATANPFAPGGIYASAPPPAASVPETPPRLAVEAAPAAAIVPPVAPASAPVNPFAEPAVTNPFATPAATTIEEPAATNPFAAPVAANPFAPTPANPFAAAPAANPFAVAPAANPFAEAPTANPFAATPPANPFATAPANPFAAAPAAVNPFAESAPVNPFAASAATGPAPTHDQFGSIASPTGAPYAPFGSGAGLTPAVHVEADSTAMPVNTGWIWLFALLPLLVSGALVATYFALGYLPDLPWYAYTGGPLSLYLLLANADQSALSKRGHSRLTSRWWALLPIVFLIIRTVRLGKGALGPLLVAIGSQIVIAVAAVVFAGQILFALTGMDLTAGTVVQTAEERAAQLTEVGTETAAREFFTLDGAVVESTDCYPFPSTDVGAVTSCIVVSEGTNFAFDLRIIPAGGPMAFEVVE